MQGLYSHLMHSSMCRCKCSAGELSTRQPECIGTINWMQGVLGKFELVVKWRRREILWLRFRCSAAHTSDGHCSAFLWISSLFPSLSLLVKHVITVIIFGDNRHGAMWLDHRYCERFALLFMFLSQLWSKQVTFYHNCDWGNPSKTTRRILSVNPKKKSKKWVKKG